MFRNPFKTNTPISSYDSDYGTKTGATVITPVEDLSQYNRGTKYGNYTDAVDFQTKLNKVARSTYKGQKDKPEEDPELIRIITSMNITSTTDFYEKIQKMLDDTMKKWETCKQSCSEWFCSTPQYNEVINGRSTCENRNNQLTVMPIGLSAKDCQAGIATSVDIKKGQKWTNVEEEAFLKCANISSNLVLITELLYVYLLDAYSEKPTYKQDDPNEDSTFALDSLLGLFKDLPKLFRDENLKNLVKKLERKIDTSYGGRRKNKSRKYKSRKYKSRKYKSRKYKSRKYKSRKHLHI